MLHFFHKGLRKVRNWQDKKRKALFFVSDGCDDTRKNSSRHIAGQVGLILILAVAVGLILYAVTINIGRISKGKTMTIMAANSAAAKMASFIASYGQMLFMTSLGGETKICAWTGFLVKLIAAIIVVVLVVVSAVTYQCEGWGLAAAIVAAVLVVAAVVIDATVTQPGITAMWNKMMADSMGPKEMAVELGVQTGLMTAVNDPAQIPDLFDFDTDSVFGNLSDPLDKTSAPDYISRFAFYYTRRLQGIPDSNSTVIDDFFRDLTDFLYTAGRTNQWGGDTDGWGLVDPLDCNLNPAHPCCPANPFVDLRFPAMCDPCCVDMAFRNPCCATGTCLEDAGFVGGNPNTCLDRSPYRTPAQPPPVPADLTRSYPYIYSGMNEDSTNNLDVSGNPIVANVSFREWLGLDDEHHMYAVNPAMPNWHYLIDGTGTLLDHSQLIRNVADYDFYMEDATGYYPTADRPGIFPFFYKLADWGTELSSLTFGATPDPARDNLECHLCDVRGIGTTVDPVCATVTYPPEIDPALVLPNLPDDATYSGGWCVDASNVGLDTEPPQLLDLVPFPWYPNTILAEDSVCAQDEGGWKRGADMFCDPPNEWPYMAECVKAGSPPGGSPPCVEVDPVTGTVWPVDCDCGEAGAAPPTPPLDRTLAANNFQYVTTNWTNDKLDDFIYGLPEFYMMAIELFETDREQLEDNFLDWYSDKLAPWIEAGCPGGVASACPGSCTGTVEPGYWYIWRDDLNSFYQPLVEWLHPTEPRPSGEAKYVGSGCFIDGSAADPAVWCVPPPQAAANKYADPAYLGFQAGYTGLECPGVSQQEQASFDISSNGRGDLEDVIACLDWNLNDPAEDPSGNPIIYPLDMGCILVGPGTNFDQDAVSGECIPAAGGPGTGSYDLSPRAALGNVEKFETCKWDCDNDPAHSLISCPILPRSLVPGFDALRFTIPMPAADLTALTLCLASESVPTCNADCAALPGGYGIPAFTATSNNAALPAPDTSLMTTLANMYAFCSANPGLTLPNQCRNQATTIDCASPTVLSDALNCSCTWYGLGLLGTCEELCGIPPTPFMDAIEAALVNNIGSCGETDPGGFKDLLDLSVLAAQNQREKMLKRVLILNGREDEAIAIRDLLSNGLNHINAFLTGPAQGIIDACKAWGNIYPPATTSFAIYAWQDLPKDVYDTVRGDWHVVKVEVRTPGRCNNACGTNRWPWIRSYTKDWGLKRCYELEERTGRVKARVIRYDEDTIGGKMRFPDGEVLWKPQYYHPEGSDQDPTDLEITCAIMIDPNIAAQTWEWGWTHAFMINQTPTASATPPRGSAEYLNCWTFIHESLLRYGYSTATCAQYFLGGGSGYSGDRSFRVRFVECDNNFLVGNN